MTIREYLSRLQDIGRVSRWIWANTLTQQMKYLALLAFVTFIIATGMDRYAELIVGKALSLVADGLYTEAMLYGGLVGVCMLLAQIPSLIRQVSQEAIEGTLASGLEITTTVMLLNKSVGQRDAEGKHLVAERIEKGKDKVRDISFLFLFSLGEIGIGVFVAYIAILLTSLKAAVIPSVGFVVYMLWSVYLNKYVAVTYEPIHDDIKAHESYTRERWESPLVKLFGKEEDELDYISKTFKIFISSI